MTGTLLEIDGLSVRFTTRAGVAVAVDDLSLEVRRGETLALVGESGSGKSVTALACLGLLPPASAEVTARHLRFDGEELLGAAPDRLRSLRGRSIAMIFQEPMTSLNPVLSIGDQVSEGLRHHHGLGDDEALAEARALLDLVGIPEPARRLHEYPHQLSGGMRQRAMIAMALSCRPTLLIADEPTTALDVTVQAQVLALLRDLRERLGMGLLLITHDLGVVAETADRVAVLYAGRIVEEAPVEELFRSPRHPYTAGLLRSLPRLTGPREALVPISGAVPDALSFPPGCRFHPRCSAALERCSRAVPSLVLRGAEGSGHRSACFAVDEAPDVDLLAARTEEPVG
ncbi:MAG: ABC transporter ATP-binding protein [Deltaproteobacteria bacterium]|nr:ABC transporter ATP-binding protein [Deltaproteobacteria bacterium]